LPQLMTERESTRRRGPASPALSEIVPIPLFELDDAHPIRIPFDLQFTLPPIYHCTPPINSRAAVFRHISAVRKSGLAPAIGHTDILAFRFDLSSVPDSFRSVVARSLKLLSDRFEFEKISDTHDVRAQGKESQG